MSIYFPKASSSRPVLTSTSSGVAIKATSQTYQLRVSTTSAANLSIGDSSTVVSVTVPIAANVAAEYFAVTPGQFYTLSSGMTGIEMS